MTLSFPHAVGGNPITLSESSVTGQPGCPTKAFGHDRVVNGLGIRSRAVSKLIYGFAARGGLPNPPQIRWIWQSSGSRPVNQTGICSKADGKPVAGVNTLEVTISTGGKDRKLDVRPLGEDHPGQYAADFIPTRRGVYTVKLSGKIESTEISNNIDIEEASDASGLQFPEPLPNMQTVNQAVSRAEAAANSAGASAAMGVVVGVVGVCWAASP